MLLAVDDYGAHHRIPAPPFYVNLEQGHVYWLRTLPQIARSRSLKQVAYRTLAWATNPKYVDQPADDPTRQELLMLHIAEKSRYEVWRAPIRRPASGPPGLDDWTLHASDPAGLGGALPKTIRASLNCRQGQRGPTMPAADMVMSPWDVPDDFVPLEPACGPIDKALDHTLSSYEVGYGPKLPGVLIISQALVFPSTAAAKDEARGETEALTQDANPEFDGPQLADETHYFAGALNGSHIHRFTAHWRYADIFCQLTLTGPPRHYTKEQLFKYASRQDRRARAALDSWVETQT